MKIILYSLLYSLLLLTAAGCGDKEAQQQPADPNMKQQANGQPQDAASPIDTVLKQQMKMYKDIKQYQYDQAEELRKAEKEQFKKLLKDREEQANQLSEQIEAQKEDTSRKKEQVQDDNGPDN